MFRPITSKYFDEFHLEFQGDTWAVCQECGGKCETNKIGSLMPGEASYIASRLGFDLTEFRNKYLDGIITPNGTVEVLKLKPVCPFINEDFQCSIKDFKPILCAIYPVVFEVKDDHVDFFLDPWCPISRQDTMLQYHFSKKGIAAVKRIPVELDWWRAVGTFDWMCVSYEKLYTLRNANLNFIPFNLDMIGSCQEVTENTSEVQE